MRRTRFKRWGSVAMTALCVVTAAGVVVSGMGSPHTYIAGGCIGLWGMITLIQWGLLDD